MNGPRPGWLERILKWRAERRKTATYAMHAHGQGKGRARSRYVVKGLRP